jgi:hypothetical protein
MRAMNCRYGIRLTPPLVDPARDWGRGAAARAVIGP